MSLLLIDEPNEGTAFDILIKDIIEEPNEENQIAISVKRNVAQQLNVDYLSKALNEPTFPVRGAFCSINSRCFFNLVCKYKEHPAINVIFLFESGEF